MLPTRILTAILLSMAMIFALISAIHGLKIQHSIVMLIVSLLFSLLRLNEAKTFWQNEDESYLLGWMNDPISRLLMAIGFLFFILGRDWFSLHMISAAIAAYVSLAKIEPEPKTKLVECQLGN